MPQAALRLQGAAIRASLAKCVGEKAMQGAARGPAAGRRLKSMFRDNDRKCLVRAANCFHSLDGHKTLYAMATLAGLKRLQDAFEEHVKDVRKASEGAAVPGIALFWVPAQCRGDFTTSAQVKAACDALEAENPSLKDSLTVLWPGAPDSEVAAAWTHIRDLDWRTENLLGKTRPCASGDPYEGDEGPVIYTTHCVDVVGETYEMLKGEIKVRAGAHHGEFFTPESVSSMMAKMLNPQPQKPGTSVLDPCCGSGRMLVMAAAEVIQEHGYAVQETGPEHPLGAGHRLVTPPPMLFVGQDIASHGPAMGRISLTALGYLNAVFVVRDSLAEPVTMEEVRATVLARSAELLRLQAGHLVTDDVTTTSRIVVTTPKLVDAPAAPAGPRAAVQPRATPRAVTLEGFGT